MALQSLAAGERTKGLAVLHFVMLMLLVNPRRAVADVTAAVGPTTAVDLFMNPLGVKSLAIVALLLGAAVVALAVGGVLKFGFKSSRKATLITVGCTFVGTFGIGYKILIYLMP